MLQIVFNEISAAEISNLPTLEQLQIFDEFKVTPDDLANIDNPEKQDDRFGKLTRDDKTLYRFRSGEHRFYFEVIDRKVIVHRILNKGSFSDFLFRTKLPNPNEDEALADSKHFWNLIEEGRQSRSNL
ncbi:MAG: hypothetical protein AAGC74_01795 [Verrucomicrobiota bacterium]